MSADATRTRWTFERGAGVAGLVAALLMFASAALGSTPDEGSATDQRLIDFYADSGNQNRIYLAALLGFAAGLLFLWFLVGLRDRLSRVEVSGLPSLVFAAGLVFVVLWFMGSIGAALPSPSNTARRSSSPTSTRSGCCSSLGTTGSRGPPPRQRRSSSAGRLSSRGVTICTGVGLRGRGW